MIESDIQRQIIDYLKMKDCLVIRLNAGKGKHNLRLAPAGTPDLFVLPKEKHNFFIEVKPADGKLNRNQIAMHEQLKERNTPVYVCRNLEDVMKLV